MSMKKLLHDLFDIGKTVIIVLIAAFIIRFFLVQPFVVEGISMEPNFFDKEYLIVNKLSYELEKPKRGEVVIFVAPNHPEYDYIKRIIALPNEQVRIYNNEVYVNGQKLEEEYLGGNEKTLVGQDASFILEKKLGTNEYFVMGDNRGHSSDSREWGVLPKENIVGKAWVSVYPWNLFGLISTPNYYN